MKNSVNVTFPAIAENASLARLVVMGMLAPLDLDAQQMTEIKTVVSEGVTNAIVHGYDGNPHGIIDFKVALEGRKLRVVIKDMGIGIVDIEQAKQPLYTTKKEEERSGLGFMIMESFTDQLEITSSPGVGTTVVLEREL